MKDAEIVAIGSEILLGDLVDSNTPWLSRRLAALGVVVHRHTTVGDDKERIVVTLLEAALRADLVVTVGGLGATPDDLTHECLREVTSREMVEYSEARRHLDEVFERTAGRKPPPSAYEQALLLEADGGLFATFPGVPTEMERMFEETLELLIRRRSEGIIVSQTLRFSGISEEELADEVRDLLGVPDPTVAPLVGPGEVGVGEVDLRVTTRAVTREEAEKKMEPIVQEILYRLSGYSLGGGHD